MGSDDSDVGNPDALDATAGRFAQGRAVAVHVVTASGVALALLALIAAVHGDWTGMFIALAVALLVDGVDGTLARHFQVGRVLPNWSGDTLDFVVDFTTYVFVPAYAIAMGGLLPAGWAVPLALIVVVTGAIYYADRRMKFADNCFRGFPALWNAIAFYLFVLKPVPWLAAALIVVLSALTFVPIRFIHPFRVRRLRTLNIAVVVAWSVLGAIALVQRLDPAPWVVWAFTLLGLYFFAAGYLGRLRRAR